MDILSLGIPIASHCDFARPMILEIAPSERDVNFIVELPPLG
jgi:hypothetical protein